ncbi:secretion protein HlyD family protein [Pirellula staleyi DSM 6068]|uniref:Secretion protein HlyD family protein n=1 Tax=Pirellula staleyi (strain ATCC 27377 / DSM 6068 / ICPB 4128) TaxID=530564 RepID=D2R872_PIRSD|nr:HlyD family efflux transporter periplasmic adaptor subunit [Pirellula staleyi]ADB15689.1 secretion protein HlyD family protein [Pirellula staleyi DSM 6068]
MSKLFTNYLLPTVAAGMLAFAFYHLVMANEVKPPLEPPVGPPSVNYESSVAGVGVVEAASENLEVGAAQSGIVLELYYPPHRVGATVKEGEPLLKIDDRQLQAQLKVNQANLRSAQASLAELEQRPRAEDLPPAEAKVRTAQANLQKSLDRYKRLEQLMASNATSQEDLNQTRYTVEASRYEVEAAEAEYKLLKAGTWDPEKEVARAAVDAAQANVEQIETEIERSIVRAPIDGQILQVNVRKGELVSPTRSGGLLVIGDLSKIYLRVDIDEEDIPRFRSAAAAKAVTRGDTKAEFPLKFVRLEPLVIPKTSLTGDNTEMVDTRVMQVIYEFVSPTAPVLVGQQLDVFVDLGPKTTETAGR